MAIVSRPIIGLRIGERLQAPEPPAPSCTIALGAPGAVGAALGAQSLDVNDQTLSKTLDSSTSDPFAAGTPDGDTITIDWSGRRAIEFGDNDAQDFIVGRGFFTSDVSSGLNIQWNGTQWVAVYGGSPQETQAGAATDTVALVIDGSTGDVEFWHEDTLFATDTTTFSSGGDILFYKAMNSNGQSLSAGASSTTTVRTAGGDMEYSYNGANDWCGNAI